MTGFTAEEATAERMCNYCYEHLDIDILGIHGMCETIIILCVLGSRGATFADRYSHRRRALKDYCTGSAAKVTYF